MSNKAEGSCFGAKGVGLGVHDQTGVGSDVIKSPANSPQSADLEDYSRSPFDGFKDDFSTLCLQVIMHLLNYLQVSQGVEKGRRSGMLGHVFGGS